MAIEVIEHDDAASKTFESATDETLRVLNSYGLLRQANQRTPWPAFMALSILVHNNFEVPSTTFTPTMRRLTFALGLAAKPRSVVAAGSYVGYTVAWLLRDRSDSRTFPPPEVVHCVDIDKAANIIAERNLSQLGHGARVHFISGDARDEIRSIGSQIDLLYIDVDEASEGKRAYCEILKASLDHLSPGACVLAHDPCVKRFFRDFFLYHDLIRTSARFRASWILPVDDCGLSVSFAK